MLCKVPFLSEYDIIVLDCDGIIFNSNNLKASAFESVVSLWGPTVTEGFMKYVRSSFGSSRYVMFKTFIVEYLKLEFDQKLYDKLLIDFAAHCEKLYDHAAFCTGFCEFYEIYKDKPMYVASGGDESELRRVFRNRGLDGRFRAILGSPAKKTDILAKIRNENLHKKIVMIGDAQADILASLENNIDFIFISGYSLDRKSVEDIARANNCAIGETLIDIL